MPSFVQIAVFLIAMALTAGVAALAASVNPIWSIGVAIAGFLFSILLAASIKVANQWERRIVLRLGEFQSIREPELFFVVPVVDRVRVVDTRVLAQDMPEDLKKIMSRQAATESEKRATITKAEGDKLAADNLAADNLAAAAMTMAASLGAMQLRTLQTIDGLWHVFARIVS